MNKPAIKFPATTGRASEGGHFYEYPSGKPAYDLMGANGKMRAVTLADARKMGLVPGVSTILGMEAKPGLVKWQVEQALMAALTLPRLPDEGLDGFITRAREDSKQQAIKAAARGTHIHAALEGYFAGTPVDLLDLPYVMPTVDWIGQEYGLEGWVSEKSFASKLCYGGKIDLHHPAKQIVTDFKCKAFGPDKDAYDLAYPEHCTQLAAYGHGLGWSEFRALNIFVSTQVPGLVCIRIWDSDELDCGWKAFQCLLELWKLRKAYRLPEAA